MGTKRDGRALGIGGGAGLLLLLAALLGGRGGSAYAGKPPPAPPPAWSLDVYWSADAPPIHLQTDDDHWMWMEPDGSGKTQLAGSLGMGLSHDRYGGQLLAAQRRTTTTFGHPDGSRGTMLRVQPVDSSTYVVLLADSSWKIDAYCRASFRPGDGHRLTFTALRWAGTDWESGLWEVGLAVDGSGNATGIQTGPTLLFPVDYIDEPTPGEGDWVPIQGHDWLDADTLVYSLWSPASADSRSSAKLYRWSAPHGAHTPLAIEGEHGWWPVLSPDGTRVAYNDSLSGDLCDAPVAGGTPYLWVRYAWNLRGSSGGGWAGYLDADTIVYAYQKEILKGGSTCDVYRHTRGQSAVNLTADTAVWASHGYER